MCSYVAQKLKLEMPTRADFEKVKQACLEKNKNSNDQSKINVPKRNLLKKYKTKEQSLLVVERDGEQQAPIDANEPVKPEEYIDILCYGNVLDPMDNLSIVNAFFKKNQIDIKLQYKKKYSIVQ